MLGNTVSLLSLDDVANATTEFCYNPEEILFQRTSKDMKKFSRNNANVEQMMKN